MGDNTEMVLEGLLCEQCGEFIDGECTGYPRLCEECEWEKVLKKRKKEIKKLTKN